MPIRATKRGAERTALPNRSAEVLVCGASFAGLAVVSALASSAARITVLDRYEIGERQTSACAAPTEWLVRLGLSAAIKQTFQSLVVRTPSTTARWSLPWTWSTFDYPLLCALLWEQRGRDVTFETATVRGRTRNTVHTDRGDVSASLIVDALGWRRILGIDDNFQPPDAPLSRGLEVHPSGSSRDLEIWIDRSYVRAGYGWCFPADDELRIGVGSFDPRSHVREPTVRLAADLDRDAEGFQGNWIPHRLRPAVEDGVFFVGDSAGHCLPLTAEGIRPALYFGGICGIELGDVVAGRQSKDSALARYGRFSNLHTRAFDWMFTAQRALPRMEPWLVSAIVQAFRSRHLSRLVFNKYLHVAHPSMAAASN